MQNRTIIVSLFPLLALLLAGCGSTSKADEADSLMERCVELVAEWAGVHDDEVASDDVSDENFSDEALDFRGTYPGGTWACGGARGEQDPRQLMVYPDGEYGERIYP